MPQPVVEAVISHLQLAAAIGGYESADRNKDAIARFYPAADGDQPPEAAAAAASVPSAAQ